MTSETAKCFRKMIKSLRASGASKLASMVQADMKRLQKELAK